jgi:hypothetical protein
LKQFLIECGVTRSSDPNAIILNVHGESTNVKLRIDNISRAMLVNVPDLLIDLLEIASYVYCADQRVGRGSEELANYGENWRRSLRFRIPVRRIEVWQSEEVGNCLRRTLGFLSDDSYAFDFRKAKAPARAHSPYFENLIETATENDEVALFSGGVDSFAGAVNDIVTLGKSVTLVGHSSSSKVRQVQDDLVGELKQRGYARKLSYIPVWVSNENVTAREYTQRARSFLFACLGIVVARLSGKNSFTFYENGVVSINPPLAGDVLGGRATRTTHPRVLRGLEELFSLILESRIEIRTPLQWMTKGEVTGLIRKAGVADMLAQTVSCTRTREWESSRKHCGFCSQCIDRRFGVLAAGMEEFDRAANYKCDLFLGDRSHDDKLRMALSYVTLFRKIRGMKRDGFLMEMPELASALGHFPGLSAEEASGRLYDLFQRHANSIDMVIEAAVSKHSAAVVRGDIPPGSLLATCLSRRVVVVEPPSNYDAEMKAAIDRLSPVILEFAFDEAGGRVLFHGGCKLEGANFRLVSELIGSFRNAKKLGLDVPFVPADHLADRLGMGATSMRQQMTRLRQELQPLAVGLGIPLDQNSLVETKERAGYRLNPECREIAVGDIRSDSGVKSQT